MATNVRRMSSASSVKTATSTDDREVQKIVKFQAADSLQNDLLLYVKMLSVVALPIVAVVAVLGLSLKQSYDRRNAAFEQVTNFKYEMLIDTLISSIRWERGASSTFTIYKGKDTATNIRLSNYRNQTDQAVMALPSWPQGIVANGTAIPTAQAMAVVLAQMRRKVNDLTANYYDILDMYTLLTTAFMTWLQVNS